MASRISEQSKEIVKFRGENPCLTGASIARKFGLSRERVRQVLSRAGEDTVSNTYGNYKACIRCGGIKGSLTKDHPYCRKCYFELHRVTLICSTCRNPFTRIQYNVLARAKRGGLELVFCSKKCQGKWLGSLHRGGRLKGSKNRVKEANNGHT